MNRIATRRKILAALVVLLLVAAGIWLYLFLTAGQLTSANSEEFPEEATGISYSKPAVYHRDLGTLTASSDIVLEGTILDAGPGETFAFPEDAGGSETVRELRIAVDRIRYNPDGIELPETVKVVEGWWADGVGFAYEDMPWAKTGQRGYFYLQTDVGGTASGPYYYTSDFGRLLIGKAGLSPSGGHHGGPWAELGADLNASRVELRIQQAIDDSIAGRAKPASLPNTSGK